MYGFGLQWALLQTYAIAKGIVLAQNWRLTSPEQIGIRAEGMKVMLSEFLVNPMDSDRGLKALAKLN